MPFPATFNVTELNGTNGFVINGIVLDGILSWRLLSMGDFNGDGLDDILVGASGMGGPYSTPGTVYVIFGNVDYFPLAFNLASLNGTNGFAINGIAAGDTTGNSGGNAGDINCDGIEDIIIGAKEAPSGGLVGASYVVFGSRNSFPASIDLIDLNGRNGFIIQNTLISGAQFGQAVNGIGDINGDGISDIAMTAINVPVGDAIGTVYVLFGNCGGFLPTVDISSIDGTNGFAVNGITMQSATGNWISNAGDVNGDGINDLIIGASGPNAISPIPGAGYVILGSRSSFPAVLSLASLNGTNGFALQGIAISDVTAYSISGAGDINGDGIDDILVGAPGAPAGNHTGAAYIIYGSYRAFPSIFEIANLNETTGFTIHGLALGDNLGVAVSNAGDINGDGVSDIILGAPLTDSVYTIFGRRGGFSQAINLNDLNGANGFIVSDITSNNNFGDVLNSNGDVNGDGILDILIGAQNAPSGGNTGASYVIYGQANTPTALCESSFSVNSIDGTNGFIINGLEIFVYSNHAANHAVSGINDINGDGVDDLIIGSSNAPPGVGSGVSYVLFGNAAEFPISINLSNFTSSIGLVITDTVAGAHTGYAVSSAGDVNGDGVDDFIVGSLLGTGGGCDVIFGNRTGFPAITSLDGLLGANGFSFLGAQPNSYTGIAVSSAGDFNGDGFDDVIVGAQGSNVDIGAAYVIFGNDTGFLKSITSSDLTGVNGFTVNGINQGDFTGDSLGYAGDFNGDGLDDIIIAAPYAPEGERLGAVYVIFGHRGNFTAEINLSDLNGANGFTINGVVPNGEFGISVSSAGDFNGDGFADIVIGAPGIPATSTYPGMVYLLFGESGPFSSFFNLTNLNGSNGFAIEGLAADDLTGWSVSGAGDVNGDGLDDIIIGAPVAPDNNAMGSAYVIYGRRGNFPTLMSLTELNGINGYTILGDATNRMYAGASVSGAGDVNGDGLDDVILSYGSFNGVSSGSAYVVFGRRCIAPSLSPSSTPSFSNSLSLSPSTTRSGSLSISISQSLFPTTPSKTPTPTSSRSSLPSFSPSNSSSESSSSLLPLIIALPTALCMFILLVLGLYVYKKRNPNNRYNFFNARRLEPIPEGGEELPLYSGSLQVESYSGTDNQDKSELLNSPKENAYSKANCRLI